ncbi:MAG: glucosylglycerol 3-phosphatase [Elainellaceae cyanobacterium]
MTVSPHAALHQESLSLKHSEFTHVLSSIENLLIIQDLDGVCMGLVKDPLHRVMDTDYIYATQSFDGHFYVLTNGEHIGQRGVNSIIERAFGEVDRVKRDGLYLPGLAAGGVQWQTRSGEVSHPGVSHDELAFLDEVPSRIRAKLQQFFDDHTNELPDDISVNDIDQCIQASVLDNVASPTANLNTCHELLIEHPMLYRALQHAIEALMNELLYDADTRGLGDSFFVHYAPNLGRDDSGHELVWFAQGKESGTTDFQFMLRGAIKEAGVLALLNRYYHDRTGIYPLGEEFSARQAPKQHAALVDLVRTNFDPALMPFMIGVGDTVTSQAVEEGDRLVFKRGGSDRNFLQLIQDIGYELDTGNIIAYVDSSGGEVKNRKPLPLDTVDGVLTVLEGPGDSRDIDDPLTLNVVFPGGYREYIAVFKKAAEARQRTIYGH